MREDCPTYHLKGVRKGGPVEGQRNQKLILLKLPRSLKLTLDPLTSTEKSVTEIWQEVLYPREWPRYCRKVYWTKMVQNGPNDHFGQNGLIPNWILAFARPRWTKMVHFGLKRSILFHLGPPTVLRPFLISTTSGQNRVRDSRKLKSGMLLCGSVPCNVTMFSCLGEGEIPEIYL